MIVLTSISKAMLIEHLYSQLRHGDLKVEQLVSNSGKIVKKIQREFRK